jgi:hypothetical protein
MTPCISQCVTQSHAMTQSNEQISYHKKKGNLFGSLFPNVLFSLILNGIDDGFEGLGIVHGQIGQHLAVDLDILGV